MGVTGAGITLEDQINMNESNAFTNKWGMTATRIPTGLHLIFSCAALIKESFPWLWAMKELIDMRPNFIPVGVGNSQATIDMSEYAMACSTDAEVDDGVELEAERSQSEDIGWKEEINDDLGVGDPQAVVPAKRKATADADAVVKRTPARPGISPTVLPPDTKKVRSSIADKFTDAAKAEEVTIQRQLELKKARIEADKELQVAKVNASAKIQMSKHDARRQLKIEQLAFEKEKALMEHKFRMAQLNSNRGSGPTAFPLAFGRLHSLSHSPNQPTPVSLAGSSRSTGFSTPVSSNSIVLEDTAGLTESQDGFGFENFDFSSSSDGLQMSGLQLPFHPGAAHTEEKN